MRSYKTYPRHYLGCSDVAGLTVVHPGEPFTLKFGSDGDYSAYFVDEAAEIPAHYQHVATVHGWMWIFDDFMRRYNARADEIKIFRAGDFGCIVQLIGEEAAS